MAKIKLTKNELKVQKENLARYTHFLPMVQLRKQQLQFETAKIEKKIKELESLVAAKEAALFEWVDVFAEEAGLEELIGFDKIVTEEGNVAGIQIPLYKETIVRKKEYDYMQTPLWVDAAIKQCAEIMELYAQQKVFAAQKDVLAEELRITTQRVNLFEKVKIPQARENIRVIRIHLGDAQTASVVRGKIAKAKIGKKEVPVV